MTATGTFRVYFNRHSAAPLVWCVATDEWEMAVRAVFVRGLVVTSVYTPKVTDDDEDGKPSAYFVVRGTLRVAVGMAYFEAQ